MHDSFSLFHYGIFNICALLKYNDPEKVNYVKMDQVEFNPRVQTTTLILQSNATVFRPLRVWKRIFFIILYISV